MKLKDKVVIVSGSARALGRAFAIRYAQEGARVVACDITDTADTVSAIESEGGGSCYIKYWIGDPGGHQVLKCSQPIWQNYFALR